MFRRSISALLVSDKLSEPMIRRLGRALERIEIDVYHAETKAVSGSVGSQSAATNVSTLRVGADRSWRSQEHSADCGAACSGRIRSIAPLHCGRGLGCETCGDRTACSSG